MTTDFPFSHIFSEESLVVVILQAFFWAVKVEFCYPVCVCVWKLWNEAGNPIWRISIVCVVEVTQNSARKGALYEGYL